jgi:endonuclease/exonuclease/phosphatase family metal-dependent hydrolase
MDAGRSKEDVDARSIQIAEYQEFLPKPETGRPWLLVELGDYNMRPYEPLMEKLVKGKDIVISVTGSRNEVDYIMVTSNNMLEVTVVRAGRADKFTGWSDHEAVEAVLTLSKLY